MIRLNAEWLRDPRTQRVMRMLTDAGHQAWFVGGCVRDGLLGRPVTDVDIATNARPDRIFALAGRTALRAVPTGFDHGTVTIVCDGLPHEVTTFRRDVKTDGRRAVVAFADRMEEDARRRDLTINALYADMAGRLADPVASGLADLKARRVRFIGDAETRIREDFLRILRFFRFHAFYGSPQKGPDAKGLAACAANADGLGTLATERIGAEMLKLLSAPDPAPVLAAMSAGGILARILPGAGPGFVAALVHLEGATPPDPIHRLAAIGGEGAAEHLRLSRADASALSLLREGMTGTGSGGELGYRLGAARARDVILLRAAMQDRPVSAGTGAEIARGAAARFPVSARDLTPALSGRALGIELKRLEAEWIASGFALSRAALLARRC